MKEAGKHLSDTNAFREVEFKEKLVTDLVGTRANFKSMGVKGCVSNKSLKYFTYAFKNSTSLGKLYLLSEIIEGYLILLYGNCYQIVVHELKKPRNI